MLSKCRIYIRLKYICMDADEQPSNLFCYFNSATLIKSHLAND